MEVHAARPRLQHVLLEETPLPERLHEILARAEREAIDAMAGWLRLFPEVRREALDRSGYLVIHTVEGLTHQFAAHPEEQITSKDDFVAELVVMLDAYLTRTDGAAVDPASAGR